jgi:hypothetical protein
MFPTTKVLATPDKSVTDEKEYRALQLHNGLRVLLIADTRVDQDLPSDLKSEQNAKKDVRGIKQYESFSF